MASEGDCGLTSEVTDRSSGSLSGDKTTGEGGLPQKSQPETRMSENENVGSSGDSPKEDEALQPRATSGPESTKEDDKENVNKLEKTKGGLTSEVTDPSSGSLSGDKTTGEGASIQHEASSGQGNQPPISVEKNEKETQNVLHSEPTKEVDKENDNNKPVKSEGDVDSSSDSSPDTGTKKEEEALQPRATSGPESTKEDDKENVNKLEKTKGDVGSSGDSAPKEDDVDSSGDSSPDTGSKKEEEPLQHTDTSERPQETQPQIRERENEKLLKYGALAVLLAAIVYVIFFPSKSTPPVPNEFNVVDVFNQEMDKLKTIFPNQWPELWRRSQIHLRRHLKAVHPTEPVSLILTSGHRAERTLDCLARCLAQAFSTALNSSVLNINGKSKASQDSDQVKLDIDSELRKAFDGKTLAAVIHRFEELPPGSTLIFYRYCDHENAAYKNVFLAFTVMLDVEVPSNVSLGRVEEMVQEHVKQKFVSSDKLATFNEMDVDKLSGLWSRISHLILPVAAEETIEQQGCGNCDKSF
ncbi:torsin-1A-interacting protein 2 isoform X2 [Chanodichthys erythropterus]|uniref:torsin-1A-interacting protein 2 isoform X2 n=1 Tax=Chanodichthys erythropterus TaxID=933992 RepID=UPI00351E7F48